MNTEHILFYPHKEYNTEKEITDNLRNKDYIQYGYIKLRDLNKWLNNEVVSVKMSMLTPSNKSYRGLTILESAIKRIYVDITINKQTLSIKTFELSPPMGKWVEFSVDGKRKRIDCDELPHTIKKSRTHYQKNIKEKIKPPYIFCGILFIVAILGVWLA